MSYRRCPWPLFALTLFFTYLATAFAEPPSTRPVEGLRDATPHDYALVNARIVAAPGRVIEKGAIVIRNRAIAAVGADLDVPDDVRVIDLTGKTVYPGLIDAYSEADVDDDKVAAVAAHFSPLVRPQLMMSDHVKFEEEENKKWRRQGITARLVAPADGVIKGVSAVVTTGDDPARRVVLSDRVALHVKLTVPRGRGREEFPNSPMGAVALARQSMLDAAWHQQAWTAYRADPKLPRPDRNPALDALAEAAEHLVVVDAMNELYLLRADRFAREFKLAIAIRGSGREYRRLDAVRETGRAVIVPVDFPKPPNVGSLESAMDVSLAEMMHWELAPENPARLNRAGVRIAMTAHGLSDADEFFKSVRKATERGLDRQAALAALTTVPAELLGIAQRAGTIESGKLASLVVTDGDLFEEKTKLLETWVDGRRYQHEPRPDVEPAGTWALNLAGAGAGWQLQLDGTDPEKLSGTLRQGKNESKLTRATLRNARLSCLFDAEAFGRQGYAQLTLVLIPGHRPRDDGGDQTNALPTATGRLVWPDGSQAAATAKKTTSPEVGSPDEIAAAKETVKSPSDKPVGAKTAADEGPAIEVNFPLGAMGRTAPPAQPDRVAFRGATVWTCGPAGVLENATVLVEAGRIVAVGSDVEVPAGTMIVNAAGKHVTPGIIDCHSHMATDGGVNESTQAITAEVRIGDFIDCDDINIYRQLAGGVTSANILHGSANPIGGQNQVIKLRWGSLSEAMKMAEAPAGIKFALGENVKQSNWGDEYTTRYPQTRMGVEQIMRDAFQAARQYDRRWKQWNADHRGLPPRRDLELEAIAEILLGKRWIHCHSYRQDEILALIRTLDDFGVRIGTFQHILEGYKVADAMAKHGAMGSAFSDWWAYKFEVFDAIPYNGALMHEAGVVVSFNSDDRELARHLNHEAAKAVKYGGVEPVEALKFVTLNPAKQLRIDQYTGSLEPGKHADLVVWSGPPLSTLSRCEQTWIDGRRYFAADTDRQARETVRQLRTRLIQRILASGETMLAADEKNRETESLWPRDDIFCHHHGHGAGHEHGSE